MLTTRFTDLLGLSYPVMSAPMSNHSGGELAAAVSAAGALGTFGGTNGFGSDWLRQQIALVRSRTDRPFGVGFITHLVGADPTNFEIALEEKVPVVIFSFSDPEPRVHSPSARCSRRSLRKWRFARAPTCCWPRATRREATPAR